MKCQLLAGGAFRGRLHDMPCCFGSNAIAPYLVRVVHSPKDDAGSILAAAVQRSIVCFTQCGTFMVPRFTFSNQVRDYPVIFSELKVLCLKFNQFGSVRATAQQERKNRSVSFAAKIIRSRRPRNCFCLFDGQPVPHAHSQPFCAFDPPDVGCKLGAEQSHIRCFAGQTTCRRQSDVNRGSCKMFCSKKYFRSDALSGPLSCFRPAGLPLYECRAIRTQRARDKRLEGKLSSPDRSRHQSGSHTDQVTQTSKRHLQSFRGYRQRCQAVIGQPCAPFPA